MRQRPNRTPVPVPRVRTRPLAELKQYVARPQRPVRVRKQAEWWPKRMHRSYTASQRLTVVYLRYGSTTDFSRICHRWSEIRRLTGITDVTCICIVNAFHKNGNSALRRPGSGRRPIPIPVSVEQYLRDSLYQHRFLSLPQRCVLV